MKEKIIYICSIIVALFIGIIGTICVYRFIPNNEAKNKKITNVNITENDSLNSSVSKVNDAVVYIASYQRNQVASSGTGFFYKKENNKAYIMTNNHVVNESSKVEITTTAGKTFEASVVGTDEYADIAVLTVEEKACNLIADIGESNESKIGDTIFTVGSPLGIEYMNTVTKGILSGKDRTVEVSYSNGDSLMEVLQIDAAINPGNSGGPLCNINGQVIGINSLKLVENEVEGMGFAIPIEYAITITEQIESGKEVKKPLIGVEMLNVGDAWQLYRNGITVDDSIEYGVVLVNVTNGKPASEAGLKKGDVIVEFAGKEVKSTAYFRYLLYKQKVGDTVKLKYYRNGKIKEASIILNESAS